ncbi:MAG: hypothetical protein AUF67_12635 [Acidobacteria bacterium 13_1_20CM_58_21]|nr:MAG: hypothetical protein AUF67_12635 [Acidobacteria bacterium 13_1_20CM_58_21]
MAGIPKSPLVLRESLGSSHNRLASAEDDEEALLSGYSPVGLLDAKNVYHAEQKGNRSPRPEPRGLRPPWGQRARRWVDATAHLAEIFPGRHVVLSEWQLFPNLIVEE